MTTLRATSRRLFGLSVAALITACTHGPARVDPLRSTRPAEQCQAARDSAAAGLVAVQPPKPKVVRLPQYIPVNSPDRRRATLTLGIDADGGVIPSRTRVTGTTDAAFAARLKEGARSYRFWPAVANGCAVPATYVMEFDL